MTARLSTVAPDLVEILEARPAVDLRRIASGISAWVVDLLGLADPRLEAGFEALSESRFGEPRERDVLNALVEELDERAWDLQDAVDEGTAAEPEYLAAFSLARAVSSLSFALQSDSLQAALESIYEAQAATGLGATRRKVHELLENGGGE